MSSPTNPPCDEAAWATLVMNFRTDLGFSRKVFAEKCGVTAHEVMQLERGNSATRPVLQKIKAFIESQPIEDEALPQPRQGFDVTCETLIRKILNLASETGRLKGVVNFSFRHTEEEHGLDVAMPIAVSILRQFLSGITDHEARLVLLLELHETVKNAKGC